MSETEIKRVTKVASVRDVFTIVLNAGSEDGIEIGSRFLIYSIGEEIFDPDSKMSLGKLEIVKGTGKVTHLQKSMCTVHSDMKVAATKTIRRIRNPNLATVMGAIMGPTETEEYLPPEPKPFEDPLIGDLAKPI